MASKTTTTTTTASASTFATRSLLCDGGGHGFDKVSLEVRKFEVPRHGARLQFALVHVKDMLKLDLGNKRDAQFFANNWQSWTKSFAARFDVPVRDVPVFRSAQSVEQQPEEFSEGVRIGFNWMENFTGALVYLLMIWLMRVHKYPAQTIMPAHQAFPLHVGFTAPDKDLYLEMHCGTILNFEKF